MVTAAFVMIVSEILRSSVGTLTLVKRIRGFGEAGVCGGIIPLRNSIVHIQA